MKVSRDNLSSLLLPENPHKPGKKSFAFSLHFLVCPVRRDNLLLLLQLCIINVNHPTFVCILFYLNQDNFSLDIPEKIYFKNTYMSLKQNVIITYFLRNGVCATTIKPNEPRCAKFILKSIRKIYQSICYHKINLITFSLLQQNQFNYWL